MIWVREEYAEELAVVAAWLTALLPWSLSYGHPGGVADFVAIRFPYVVYENLSGFGEQLDGTRFITPWGALERDVTYGLQQSLTRQEFLDRYGTASPGLSVDTLADALAVAPNAEAIWAYLFWSLGILVLTVAVILSFLLYFETDLAENLPVDPVRTMGGLLAGNAVLFAVATVMLYLQFPGLYVPVGPFIYGALAVILLSADRT